MKVVAGDIFKFSLPLKKTLSTGPIRLSHRDGLVVRLVDESNHFGYGEISPLPGLHAESLPQALQQIQLLIGQVEKLLRLEESMWDQWAQQVDLHPSVRFGLESALLELVSQNSGRPPTEILFGRRPAPVQVNALLTGNADDILETARRRVGEGYRSLKIKVGRKPVDEEAEIIKTLSARFGSQVSLRLDANRAWTLAEASHFAEQVGHCNIEYIEEPLKKPQQLEMFAARSPLPVALDESLGRFPELPGYISAVILKPSCFGLGPTLRTMDNAISAGITPIISSSFESGLGLRTLARLSAWANGSIAMGLDTWRWLAEDLTDPPFRAWRGFIAKEQLTDQFSMNQTCLRPL